MSTPSSNASSDSYIVAQRGGEKKTRTRTWTSHVWSDLKEIYKILNGKSIRTSTKCNVCKKVRTASSTCGAGHSIRHLASCMRKAYRFAKTQSVLKFNRDGSVTNSEIISRVTLLLWNWTFWKLESCFQICLLLLTEPS